MNGMCKNFKYTARPDGGYDCETEIIEAGEILESLKGEKMTLGKRTADAMELGLDYHVLKQDQAVLKDHY